MGSDEKEGTMSYARFGHDRSNVYVFRSSSKTYGMEGPERKIIVCSGCSLCNCKSQLFEAVDEAINHLRKHQAVGQIVPDYVFEKMEADVKGEKKREGENKMKGEEISSGKDFDKCVDFHGHICPGLAIGFRAAQILMRRSGLQKALGEEFVAIVETDACGADAIQVMTGCTFGKGNFIFRNYGKHAFSILDRKRRGGVRVCVRPDFFKADPEGSSLLEKVQNDEAPPNELERFRQLQQERTKKILDADSDSLFKIEEISSDIPRKARIMNSGICDFCGEPTQIDLLHQIDGRKICIPCAHQQGL